MPKYTVEDLQKDKKLGKRAVIYARYSSDKQKEESIEQQIEHCLKYIESRGYEHIGNYCDYAKSASHDVEKRTEFLRMLDDAKEDKFDVVVAYSLNRISRAGAGEFYDYKKRFADNGVRIEYATEKYEEDFGGAITEAIQVQMSKEYVNQLRKMTVRGMMDNSKAGRFNGGCKLPGIDVIDDGRKGKRYAINEEVAPYMKRAFEKYLSGETTTEIARFLSEKGVKNGRGNPVTMNNLRHYLSNPLYCGKKVTVFDNVESHTRITTEDVCEPIVSEEVWERAQIETAKRAYKGKTVSSKQDYLLLGKLYCGECGDYMITDSGKSKGNDRNKTPRKMHYYYACHSRKKKTGAEKCVKKNVPKEALENAVIDIITNFIWNEEECKRFADSLRDEKTVKGPDRRRQQIKKELATHAAKLKKFKSAYIQTDNDTWLDEVDAETKVIATLESELKELDRLDKNEMSPDDFVKAITELRRVWDKMRSTNEGCRKLINNFVERVVVYNSDPDKPGKIRLDLIFLTELGSIYGKSVSAEVDLTPITNSSTCKTSSSTTTNGSPLYGLAFNGESFFFPCVRTKIEKGREQSEKTVRWTVLAPACVP